MLGVEEGRVGERDRVRGRMGRGGIGEREWGGEKERGVKGREKEGLGEKGRNGESKRKGFVSYHIHSHFN